MIVGHSYNLRRRKADVQRSINLMPTPMEAANPKGTQYLAPVPGLRTFSLGPQPCVPYGAPELFGSGTHCAFVESTREVWSIWRSDTGGGRPLGLPDAAADLNGTYALVYNADTLGWITAVRLGGIEPSTWLLFIVERNGFLYASIASNRLLETAFFPDVTPAITKISASTRAIVSTTSGTPWVSAVVKIGLISMDADAMHISNVEGVGGGTAEMDPDTFLFSGSETAAHPMAEWAFNPTTGVRAYAGVVTPGGNIDLRGDFVGTVVMNDHVSGMGTANVGRRLLARTEGPEIFAMAMNRAGLLAIDSSDGSVVVISSTFIARAMYYSPDSDRLFVEGKESLLAPLVVREYSAGTLDLITTHTDRSSSEAFQNGNSVYMGCESFIACEGGTGDGSRMWRVGFPHAS